MGYMNQLELFSKFNDTCREKFNPVFFTRSTERIVDEVKKAIISSQRDQPRFKFLVKGFEVIDDYIEIQRILHNYEANLRKSGKMKNRDNPYSFINLRETDMVLLKVIYHIETKEGKYNPGVLDLIQYLAIPRVVKKFLFKLSGTYYSSMFQITDGSTYNSETSKKKNCDTVVFQTPNMTSRFFRSHWILKLYNNSQINITNISVLAFSRLFNMYKYIFARYGWYNTLSIYGLGQFIQLSNEPLVDSETHYSFKTGNKNIYCIIPIDLFNKDVIIQSIVSCICNSVDKNCKEIDRAYSTNFWLESLGQEFGYGTVDKGRAILGSLENIYDINTKENLHLPEEKKRDIYHILLWIAEEFTELMKKDNLDLSVKRFRYAEVPAALMSMKLGNITHSLSDAASKNKIDMDRVLQLMRGIKPTFLISALTKSQLMAYRSDVNDLDSFTAMKFTYKNVSLDNTKSSNRALIYRNTHYSHLGRIDMDSSTKSDPGLSGNFCPLMKSFGNNDESFSDYEEPCGYKEAFDKTMEDYYATLGLKNILEAQEGLLGKDNKDKLEFVNCSLDIFKNLMHPVMEACNYELSQQSSDRMIPLDQGGMIYYEY